MRPVSGQQSEARDVPGAYDAEVPVVERGDLADDQVGHDERSRGLGQQLVTDGVVLVLRGRGGVQRPGVDDQHDYEAGWARSMARPTNSSTRSETSGGSPAPIAENDSRPTFLGSFAGADETAPFLRRSMRIRSASLASSSENSSTSLCRRSLTVMPRILAPTTPRKAAADEDPSPQLMKGHEP
jgi:hypothetical protein